MSLTRWGLVGGFILAAWITRAPAQPAATALADIPVDPPAAAPYMVPAGRSPLLQPGETMRRPIPYTIPAMASSSAPAKQASSAVPGGPVIAWQDAPKYVGQTITVEGKILDTHLTSAQKPVCFLNFTRERQSPFYVIIFDKSLSAWPGGPQQYFLNKTIRVQGKVYEYQGRTQIRVEDPGQIQLVP